MYRCMICDVKEHFHSTVPDLMSVSISEELQCHVHIDRHTGQPKVWYHKFVSIMLSLA